MCLMCAQVIGASDDGKEYGQDDAQLQLENGTPRSAFGRCRCEVMPRAGCAMYWKSCLEIRSPVVKV